MILPKILIAATMSATVLWLAPIHGDGQHPAHEQCDCGHEHTGYAMPTTTTPDAHIGHSAVYAKEKCDNCNGKGKVNCLSCDGKGKITYTDFTQCSRCKGTGGIKGLDGKLIVKCPACVGRGGKSKERKEKCGNCNGKGKLTCMSCGGNGKKN